MKDLFNDCLVSAQAVRLEEEKAALEAKQLSLFQELEHKMKENQQLEFAFSEEGYLMCKADKWWTGSWWTTKITEAKLYTTEHTVKRRLRFITGGEQEKHNVQIFKVILGFKILEKL